LQNLLSNAGSVKGEGKIYGALGKGRVPMIDIADIAAVGAEVLTSPSAHNGKTLYLTGGEAYSMDNVAEKIGKAIGKTVTYVDLPNDVFVGNLKKMGLPGWLADDFGKMYAWLATDQAATPSDTVEKITGRKPRTLDAFLADTAATFK